MWKAFFLAIGICMVILGAELLLIDRAVLARPATASASPSSSVGIVAPREFVPAEWTPWSLLTGGVVIIIYSFNLPRLYASE